MQLKSEIHGRLPATVCRYWPVLVLQFLNQPSHRERSSLFEVRQVGQVGTSWVRCDSGEVVLEIQECGVSKEKGRGGRCWNFSALDT